MAKTFKELVVWQKAMELVTSVYAISSKFPKDELWGLTSQVRRCSVSIPSNLSEGFGRNTRNEFKRYISIAIGSLFELQTQLQIAENLKYINSETHNELFEKTREIEAMLVALKKSLER